MNNLITESDINKVTTTLIFENLYNHGIIVIFSTIFKHSTNSSIIKIIITLTAIFYSTKLI